MGIAVHLLSAAPRVERDGVEQPAPRGRKAWALLAYLLLRETPPSRAWLCDLLFADAEDPRGALSWNLTRLRRLLGPDAELGGDPVRLRLPDGAFVDAHTLAKGSWTEAVAVPGIGHDLLEGMAFDGSAGFEAWLLANRRHLAETGDEVLREAARAHLSDGAARTAIELASRLVAANPLDEDAQEILIRGYVAAGDLDGARRQQAACVTHFQRELGTAPGPGVLAAAEPVRVQAVPRATVTTATTRLEAGLDALDAGAADTAVDVLRQAVADAAEVGDGVLRVRALTALGAALVHAVRGRDGEGAELLQEAIRIADETGEPQAGARAHRELGYVETLRGRYDRAQHWLAEALRLAGDDAEERAWALAVSGVASSDIGRHEEAMAAFAQALELARERGLRHLTAWVQAHEGRLHLLRGDLAEARSCLSGSLASGRDLRWTAFVPLPEVLLGDVDLAEGDVAAATAAYEHAHALATQLGDPCWEGYAMRGLGMLAAHRGDLDTAVRLVSTARTECVRLPDAHQWVEGYCLDALCAIAVEQRLPEAEQWSRDLVALATRYGMRELAARAYAHLARLGEPAAAEAARVLAAEVDNPALAVSVPAARAPGDRRPAVRP